MQEKRKIVAAFIVLSFGLLATLAPIKTPRYQSSAIFQASASNFERLEITFDSINGSPVESQNVSFKGRIKTPLAPIRDGYTFIGWKTESGVSWNFVNNQVTESMTLYASWTIVNYPITYNLDEGTNSPDNPTQYNITSKIILMEPTKNGYIFIGWEQEGNIPQGSTGPRIFTAIWKANEK